MLSRFPGCSGGTHHPPPHPRQDILGTLRQEVDLGPVNSQVGLRAEKEPGTSPRGEWRLRAREASASGTRRT